MRRLIDLPVYECHKRVEAAKIKEVRPFTPPTDLWAAFLKFEGAGIVEGIYVPQEFLDKHAPQPGGYYVRYEDGYTSYSPAQAFESGYTLAS